MPLFEHQSALHPTALLRTPTRSAGSAGPSIIWSAASTDHLICDNSQQSIAALGEQNGAYSRPVVKAPGHVRDNLVLTGRPLMTGGGRPGPLPVGIAG
jgi:hypothetical protein